MVAVAASETRLLISSFIKLADFAMFRIFLPASLLATLTLTRHRLSLRENFHPYFEGSMDMSEYVIRRRAKPFGKR